MMWQSAIVSNAKRLDWRHWLAAARHPARKDGAIAVVLLVLPWVIALALERRHHLDAAAVAVLVPVSIPLAALWLAWVPVRNATSSETSTTGSGSVFAGHGGTAFGQVVQQRPGVTGKPVRLAGTSPFLVGREDLLADLHTRLSAGDGPWPRIAVLCGLGGAGKTSVALAYAHRHLAEVEVAWQIAAENPTVLADGFGQLAAQLGVRNALDLRDPVASVHGMLAAFPAEWLLVLDDAPDQATVEGLVPRAGRGRVLITSRNPDWPGRALEVPVLAPAVAAEFLIRRTGDQDRQAALDLAVEMGGLPLALEQAAAYLVATGDSLAVYLALFRQRRPDLLARGDPAGYMDTVASTWSLAFGRLEPAAVGLLRLLAFCAPDAIPWRLLLQLPRGPAKPVRRRTARADWQGRAHIPWRVARVLTPLIEDPLAAGDAIKALRGYSLVTPAGDGAVSLHRLVQAVIVDQMPAQRARQWRQAAAALIEASIPPDPERPDTWPVFAALLPHAEAVLAEHSDVMDRIASYLESSGNYRTALDLQRRVVDARERVLGPERPRTLYARAWLALRTGAAGDAAAARDQFAALLPVLERVRGLEHPETLGARGHLANWTGTAGDATAARDQFAALLPVVKRVRGPEHPDTLEARGTLANWTGAAGDPAAARDQLAGVQDVQERIFGTEHPSTLAIRVRLAGWTGAAGDAAASRDQLAALLPVLERVYGPEHPSTLAARVDLAVWTGAGDAAAARDQVAALLPVLERVYGPEHPSTLDARDSLADWTGRAGDAAAARDQVAALLPVLERLYGPEHVDTLDARGHLAEWTGVVGDAAAARDQFAALLPVLERILGPEHPSTLAARGNLAHWTGTAGNADTARDQVAALLPVLERVHGPEHPFTLFARDNLAHWTGKAGAAAAARDQVAALLPVLERVLGPEHPKALGARGHLAHWTGKAGAAAAARDQLAELASIYDQLVGPEHPFTLFARGGLARWTGRAGDAAAARDQVAALLPVLERVLGPEHPSTLDARDSLADWTETAGDAAAARDQLAALLPVLERVLGPEHPSTLDARGHFARWTRKPLNGTAPGVD
jgi:Tetratricopeptide repeat